MMGLYRDLMIQSCIRSLVTVLLLAIMVTVFITFSGAYFTLYSRTYMYNDLVGKRWTSYPLLEKHIELDQGEDIEMDQDREVILRDMTKLPAAKKLSGPQTTWDDPELIQFIREELLDAPRPHVTKLSFPLFQTPQAQTVNNIFQAKRDGFFVECGAMDGERSSNTIWLEQKGGWTGLLVEMDPSYYLQIIGKNRKAHSSNVCLSPEPYPVIMEFIEHFKGSGRLATDDDFLNGTTADLVPTICVPLYSLMLAMNRTVIDYFSLDAEGFEMPILQSIPFDKLDISVMTVDYAHGKEMVDADTDEYVQFMASKGYDVHSKIDKVQTNINLYAHDYVFVKNASCDSRIACHV